MTYGDAVPWCSCHGTPVIVWTGFQSLKSSFENQGRLSPAASKSKRDRGKEEAVLEMRRIREHAEQYYK